MAWILLVDFDFSLLTRIPYVKHTNCENSRSAAKVLLEQLVHNPFKVANIMNIVDWSLFVTTFKSAPKTHLLWKLQVLWQRRVSIRIYLTKFSFLQVCKSERTEAAMAKKCVVLKFHKSHRKAFVPEFLF